MLTRHRVFTGPGFAVATELGDAASGGQVLLSQDAWLRLEGNMGQAAFPTLEQLGLFKLEAWPAPIWIYQVSITCFACWSPDNWAWGTWSIRAALDTCSTLPGRQALEQISSSVFLSSMIMALAAEGPLYLSGLRESRAFGILF